MPNKSPEFLEASPAETGEAVANLVILMNRLRQECPWDRKQTFSDLTAYLLEETHEVLAALQDLDLSNLEGELGDLLFQIVFLARLGSEQKAFDLASLARRVHSKMVARHPHVFGERPELEDSLAVRKQWEDLKATERQNTGTENASPFEGLPKSLPALLRASRMTSRAADLGFDWHRDTDVIAKLEEETAEFRAELERAEVSKERVLEETGDILFTVVNVARRHGVDPEAALTAANRKFERRFAEVVTRARKTGRSIRSFTLEELDAIWDEVKKEENKSPES